MSTIKAIKMWSIKHAPQELIDRLLLRESDGRYLVAIPCHNVAFLMDALSLLQLFYSEKILQQGYAGTHYFDGCQHRFFLLAENQ